MLATIVSIVLTVVIVVIAKVTGFSETLNIPFWLFGVLTGVVVSTVVTIIEWFCE